MRRVTVVGIVAVLALVAGAVSARVAQPLFPLVSDWQQYFRIDTDSSVADGRAVVSGKVWNTSSWSGKRIQLLVEGLDADSQPVTQRVVWLGVNLGSGMHTYFEVPMPAAASYRVSVFAFTRGGGRWD